MELLLAQSLNNYFFKEQSLLKVTGLLLEPQMTPLWLCPIGLGYIYTELLGRKVTDHSGCMNGVGRSIK